MLIPPPYDSSESSVEHLVAPHKFTSYVRDLVEAQRDEPFTDKTFPHEKRFVGGHTRDVRVGVAVQYNHGVRWGVMYQMDPAELFEDASRFGLSRLSNLAKRVGFLEYTAGGKQSASRIETTDFIHVARANGEYEVESGTRVADMQGWKLEKALGMLIPAYVELTDNRFGAKTTETKR